MEIFAKIFTVQKYQVLVTKSFNQASDEYEVTIQTQFNGLIIEQTLSYFSKRNSERVFHSFNQLDANSFIFHNIIKPTNESRNQEQKTVH